MTQPLSPDLQQLAHALAEARRHGRQIRPPAEPATVSEALAVQAAIARLRDDVLAGWKIARHAEFGMLGAPLLAAVTRSNGAEFSYPVPLAVEVEIAFRLADDLPSGVQDVAAVSGAIDGMCVGVELVHSRLSAGPARFLPFLADGLANAGYVTGDWQAYRALDLPAQTCTVTWNDAVLFEAACVPSQGTPLSVLQDAPRADLRHFGGLRRGQVITTGSLCGVVALPGRDGRLTCRIGDVGAVTVHITST